MGPEQLPPLAASPLASGLEIDHPNVKAEVEAVFAEYERALVTNDVTVLDRLFLDEPTTIRYGGSENLYGYAEIAAFRAGRSPAGLARRLERTVITTYGRDFAVASTLFRRDSAPGQIGRQTQTWVRTLAGWRVAAAHVSIIDEPR
jgi:AtzH-like